MICKCCNEKFPNKTFLNGKEVVLNSRSYCLNCSPFGERKYKDAKRKVQRAENPDIKKCPICEKEFKWTKNNVCSTCRNWYRRLMAKLRAIAILGSVCRVCGENDPDLLTFHHKDKNEKSFTLAQNWSNINWEEIENELAKCELLCFHCHIKHHKKENIERFAKITEYYAAVVESVKSMPL